MIRSCAISEINVNDLHRLRKQCHVVFEMLDKDGDQKVSAEEFLRVVPTVPWLMALLGISEALAKDPNHDVRDILMVVFQAIDTSRDHSIDITELVHYLYRRHCDNFELLEGQAALSSGDSGGQTSCPRKPSFRDLRSAASGAGP